MSPCAVATEDEHTNRSSWKEMITMQSVAAYYVLVASELANQASAKPRYDFPPRKPSRFANLRNVFSRPLRQAASAA
jgi:hypothetical protein